MQISGRHCVLLTLALALAFHSSGYAATPIVHVQTAAASQPGGVTATVSLKATQAGDLVLVGIASSGGKPSKVIDNKGDTYTSAVSRTVSGSVFAIYYSKTVPAGVTSVTVTYPYGTTDIIVSEYSGTDPSAPLDRTSSYENGWNSGAPYTSGFSGTTLQPSELAWAFSGNAYTATTTWTVDAGWTPRLSVGESFVQDQIINVIGSYAATGSVKASSSDCDVVSLLVTLKGATAGAPPDTTPPTVSVTSPSTGAAVAKTVNITATASDNVGVAGVQFQIDGVLLSTVSTAPYATSWDTTTYQDGSHTITAVAKDTSNNSTTSAPVIVTLNNAIPFISSFVASPAYLVPGGTSTLQWTTTNATSLSISGIGTVTGTSTVVTPATTTTYILTAASANGSATAQATITVNNGVSIIVDSDFAANVDDVGDHAVLWALAKTGEANVLALITSSSNDQSAPAVYALANYYKHPNVPIGAYQGTSPNGYSYTNSYYAQQLTTSFGKAGDKRSNYPDAVTVYRRALASATNNSVYIIAGGFYEPLRSLLMSPADSISSLTGLQLVAQKVAALVPASGWYPDSTPSASFNFAATPDAASYVFANWPTKVILFGTDVGGDVLTGPSASADPAANPVKDAYNLYCSNGRWCPNMQYGWTQTAILYAVRGLQNNFVFAGTNGTVTVWGSPQSIPGRDFWTTTPGNSSYLRKNVPAATLAAILNQLMQAAP